MTFYLDARVLQKPQWRGEQYYVHSMIREMVRLGGTSHQFHLHFGWDGWDSRIDDLLAEPGAMGHVRRGKRWSHLSVPLEVMRTRSRVMYRMYNEDRRMWVPMPRPMAILVHDNGRFMMPEHYGRANVEDLRRDRLSYIHRFALIIVVSNRVKEELIDLFGLDERRIVVASNGVDRPDAAGPMSRPAVIAEDARFFLMVGPGLPNKNWQDALAGFARYLHGGGEDRMQLVLAGALFNQEGSIRAAIAADPLLEQRVICTGYVSEAQMDWLYWKARLLLFPSRYEGFGRPIVEAMAHELPVIAADIPISREVGGDAAVYVPLDDPQALAETMKRVNENEELRGGCISRGNARVEFYNWTNSARITLEALMRVGS